MSSFWLRLAALLLAIAGAFFAVAIFNQSRDCIGDPVPVCEPLRPNPFWVMGATLALVVGLLLIDAAISRRGQ